MCWSGVAAALKIYPGVFILYWLWTRQWRKGQNSLATLIAVTGAAWALWPRMSSTFFFATSFGPEWSHFHRKPSQAAGAQVCSDTSIVSHFMGDHLGTCTRSRRVRALRVGRIRGSATARSIGQAPRGRLDRPRIVSVLSHRLRGTTTSRSRRFLSSAEWRSVGIGKSGRHSSWPRLCSRFPGGSIRGLDQPRWWPHLRTDASRVAMLVTSSSWWSLWLRLIGTWRAPNAGAEGSRHPKQGR